jgi:two-component system, OmpR family, phosphate regulon sensor histidine kinase PhoR
MKRKNFQLILLVVTFTCLIILIGIQFVWIVRSARMQEAQFNHSVTMAMNKIVDNLSRDRAICSEVTNCLREGTTGSCYLMMKNRDEWANIGTMIKEDLKSYGITLDFEFDIVDKKENPSGTGKSNVYFTGNLEEVLNQSGYELRIKFPEKGDFIKAQIGYMFISSIVLLILVSFLFLLIFRYYRREKKLSEDIVDIINNMTHEFRTPLTNIALANNMIARNEAVEKDEKILSYSRVIASEQKRLKDRVDELLKMSFSESEKANLSESVNLTQTIEKVIATFDVQLKSKNGRVEFIKTGNDIFIKGEEDSISVAAGNLIDNALKYNSGSPVIVIKLENTAKTVKLEISDNGIGIPSKYHSEVFRKYFRVPTGDIHNNDGFGLGLYYVRNTINRMGGSIKITSNPGKGSSFTIEFPAENLNG